MDDVMCAMENLVCDLKAPENLALKLKNAKL